MNPIENRAEVETAERTVTYSEVMELIARSLASLRIYVVESDITDAQNSVRAIVEKATF